MVSDLSRKTPREIFCVIIGLGCPLWIFFVFLISWSFIFMLGFRTSFVIVDRFWKIVFMLDSRISVFGLRKLLFLLLLTIWCGLILGMGGFLVRRLILGCYIIFLMSLGRGMSGLAISLFPVLSFLIVFVLINYPPKTVYAGPIFN